MRNETAMSEVVDGLLLLFILICIASAQIDTKSANTTEIQEHIFNDTIQSGVKTQCRIKYIKHKKSYLRYVRVPDHLEYHTTFRGCLKKCCYVGRFQCKSFSFVRLTNQCFLMNVTRHSNNIVMAFSEIHVHVEVLNDRDSNKNDVEFENGKLNQTKKREWAEATEPDDASNISSSTLTTKIFRLAPHNATVSSSTFTTLSDAYPSFSEISTSMTQMYENIAILETPNSTLPSQSAFDTRLPNKSVSYEGLKITGHPALSTISTEKVTKSRREKGASGFTSTKGTKFIYTATITQRSRKTENLKATTISTPKITSETTTSAASATATNSFNAINTAPSTTPYLSKHSNAEPKPITTTTHSTVNQSNIFTKSTSKITSKATAATASAVTYEAIKEETAPNTTPGLPKQLIAEPTKTITIQPSRKIEKFEATSKSAPTLSTSVASGKKTTTFYFPNLSNVDHKSSPKLAMAPKAATVHALRISSSTTPLTLISKFTEEISFPATAAITNALNQPTSFQPKAMTTESAVPTRPATAPKRGTTMKQQKTSSELIIRTTLLSSTKLKPTKLKPTTLYPISLSRPDEESTITTTVQKTTLVSFDPESVKTKATSTRMNPNIKSNTQTGSVKITKQATATATHVSKPTEITKSTTETLKSSVITSTIVRSALKTPSSTTSKIRAITKSPELPPSTTIKPTSTLENSKPTMSIYSKSLASKRASMPTTQVPVSRKIPGTPDTSNLGAASQESTTANKSFETTRQIIPTRFTAEKYPNENKNAEAVRIQDSATRFTASSVTCLKQCENGGKCQQGKSNNAICVCKIGFAGVSCELKIDVADTMETWRIILISIACIILIIFIGYIMLYIAYRKRALGKYDVAKRFRNRPYGTDAMEEFSEARGASHSSLYWHDSMTMSSTYSASGSV